MYIERMIYPTKALGPGNRLAIWTIGCKHYCHDCSNPELWEIDENKRISVSCLLNYIKKIFSLSKVDGISITGGDPLEQYEELKLLLIGLKGITDDILVYTGYVFEDLPLARKTFLRSHVTVLIDGPYIKVLNESDIPLRGSKNQKLHIFDEKHILKYLNYCSEGRKIQNIVIGSSRAISVGIHNKEVSYESMD